MKVSVSQQAYTLMHKSSDVSHFKKKQGQTFAGFQGCEDLLHLYV